MAHYVSGRLPFALPPRLRGVGQLEREPAQMSLFQQTLRPVSYDSALRPRPMPGSKKRVTKVKAKRKRRALKHGDTIYCVYVGRKKISCSRSKERATKVADREKLKRAKKTGVRIKKQKWELKCPSGSRRVCKERKKGSRACRRMGCTKKR